MIVSQLTFGDEASATVAEPASSSSGAPIAIVSIANGVVGSASSKDASKTSVVVDVSEEEEPVAEEAQVDSKKSDPEVLKNLMKEKAE